jgi:hypothetical protein
MEQENNQKDIDLNSVKKSQMYVKKSQMYSDLTKILKSKKYPIGTIRNGKEKVAEGKWVPVKEGKGSKGEEKTDPKESHRQDEAKRNMSEAVKNQELVSKIEAKIEAHKKVDPNFKTPAKVQETLDGAKAKAEAHKKDFETRQSEKEEDGGQKRRDNIDKLVDMNGGSAKDYEFDSDEQIEQKLKTIESREKTLGEGAIDGEMVQVKKVSDSEFEIIDKKTGEKWYSDADGNGSIPDKFQDSPMEAEAMQLISDAGKGDSGESKSEESKSEESKSDDSSKESESVEMSDEDFSKLDKKEQLKQIGKYEAIKDSLLKYGRGGEFDKYNDMINSQAKLIDGYSYDSSDAQEGRREALKEMRASGQAVDKNLVKTPSAAQMKKDLKANPKHHKETASKLNDMAKKYKANGYGPEAEKVAKIAKLYEATQKISESKGDDKKKATEKMKEIRQSLKKSNPYRAITNILKGGQGSGRKKGACNSILKEEAENLKTSFTTWKNKLDQDPNNERAQQMVELYSEK